MQPGCTQPYHGYYSRVLNVQGPNAEGGQHTYVVKDWMIGAFALVAFPARYEVSGIHTFIVNRDGAIYEKDLGAPAPHLSDCDPLRPGQILDTSGIDLQAPGHPFHDRVKAGECFQLLMLRSVPITARTVCLRLSGTRARNTSVRLLHCSRDTAL